MMSIKFKRVLKHKNSAVIAAALAVIIFLTTYLVFINPLLNGLLGEAVMGHIPPAADDFLYYGQEIQIRSDSFNNFLSARGNSQKAKIDLQVESLSYEVWKIINPDNKNDTGFVTFNSKVAFQSVNFGNYLSTNTYNDQGSAYLMGAPLEDEWWRIVNSYDRTSNTKVSRIDTVLIRSYKYQGYLSALGYNPGSDVKMKNNPGTWEKWAIQPKDYYMNWMSTTSRIENKPLQEITFPASHDAGAYNFLIKSKTLFGNLYELAEEDENRPLRDALKKIHDTINLKDTINVWGVPIPVATLVLEAVDPLVEPKFYESIAKLSRTTDLDVGQQLRRGVRWLDLRVAFRNDGSVYTHHMLIAQTMDNILNQTKDFLNQTKGEIVVLELSHFVGDMKNYDAFKKKLVDLFGDYIYTKDISETGTVINNPMRKTYSEVVGSNAATRKSKVILLMDLPGKEYTALAEKDKSVWTYNQLNLNASKYDYSNQTNRSEMIDDQVQKFKEAKNADESFMLWYTLTTNADDGTKIVVHDIVGKITDTLRPALISDALDMIPLEYIPNPVSFISSKVSNAMRGWLNDLDGLIYPQPNYKTTEDLTKRLDEKSGLLFEKSFQGRSNPYGYNRIAVLYGDYFYTNTDLVDVAIDYSRLPCKEDLKKVAANSAYPQATDIVSGDWYYIKNKQTGNYLNVNDARDADGTQVIQYAANVTKAQQWKVIYNTTTGLYTLESAAAPERVLDIYSADNTDGAKTDIWSDNGSPGMQYAFEASPNTNDGATYRIRTASSDLKMMVVADPISTTQKTSSVVQKAYIDDKLFYEDWMFEPLPVYTSTYPEHKELLQSYPSGIFYIYNGRSNKALAIDYGKDENGAAVQQWMHTGQEEVLWKIEYTGNGLYRFVSHYGKSNRVLDMTYNNDKDGATADIWKDNGSLSMRFALEILPVNDPESDYPYRFIIRTQASNFTKVLALKDGTIKNGDKVVQKNYTDDSDESDVWYITPAEGFQSQEEVSDLQNGARYYIKNKNSGKYMDVSGQKKDNNTTVSLQNFTGNENQQWMITFTKDGHYVLESYGGNFGNNPSKVLNITRVGSDKYSGADLYSATIQEYNNTRGMHIEILPCPDGDNPQYMMFTQCTDFRNHLDAAGNNIVNTTYSYNTPEGVNSSLWYFEPVMPKE